MSKQNNGGPAFPVINAPGAPEDYPGMTLRDYFAAMAMQAAITGLATNREPYSHAECAAHSYEQADAMLRVRSAS